MAFVVISIIVVDINLAAYYHVGIVVFAFARPHTISLAVVFAFARPHTAVAEFRE